MAFTWKSSKIVRHDDKPEDIGLRFIAVYAQHGMGVIFRVRVPNGGWRAPTVSQGQGRPPRGGI
ncbi:hypothetical protein JCM16163A_14400 [Paenibacillus sp. YK5]